MNSRVRRFVVLIGLAVAAVGVSACSLDKQEMPPLSGPSELSLSLTVTASPDHLSRGTGAQSIVTIAARDASGNPIAGQRIALSLGSNAPQGAALSQSEVTTGSNGTATFAVTAPNINSLGNIAVVATPIGTNAGNGAPRVITITALPENSAAPVITDFVISNSSPDIGETVTFDASCQPSTTCATTGVTDEGVPCNACTFSWSFGDGSTASGQIVRHAFAAGGQHNVALTAIDPGNVTSALIKTVTVNGPSIPTGLGVTMSPNPAVVGQVATFTASATAAANHRIVVYQFVFGDGSSTTQATPIVQHAYGQIGTYPFTLTVRDDLGQTATTNVVITVSSGLTASFTVTVNGTTASFDASASSSSTASTITDYAWDFENDGSYDTNGSSPTVSHDYGGSGTFTAKLRITDNRGVTQTTTRTVTIP